jgi:hypothetical protein
VVVVHRTDVCRAARWQYLRAKCYRWPRAGVDSTEFQCRTDETVVKLAGTIMQVEEVESV